MSPNFTGNFTQQLPIPEEAIERAVAVMRSGRLHRYNVADGEVPETVRLENEFAAYMGARFCLACTSGGYALQTALRAFGLSPGEPVLTNGFTLSPVPGAIAAAGGPGRCSWRSPGISSSTSTISCAARGAGPARRCMERALPGHRGDSRVGARRAPSRAPGPGEVRRQLHSVHGPRPGGGRHPQARGGVPRAGGGGGGGSSSGSGTPSRWRTPAATTPGAIWRSSPCR